jgi:hypothetical protein
MSLQNVWNLLHAMAPAFLENLWSPALKVLRLYSQVLMLRNDSRNQFMINSRIFFALFTCPETITQAQ